MAFNVSDADIIANSFNKYIVSPLNAFGIGGFVFDVEGETSVTLTTEITDHFVEDGTTIQDHIAVKPKRVTLKNYVGELTYKQYGKSSASEFIEKAVQKLTTVSAYLPKITDMAKQVWENKGSLESLSGVSGLINNAELGSINKVSDLYASVKNMVGPQTKQAQAYMFFKAMMEGKILTSVQTPFEFMSNMAIESITAVQEEGSKYISSFSVTLKEIRTAELLEAAEATYIKDISGKIDDPITWNDPIAWNGVKNMSPVTAVQNTQPKVLGNIQGIDLSDPRRYAKYYENQRILMSPAPPLPGSL